MTDTSAVNCPLWTVLADTFVPSEEVLPLSNPQAEIVPPPALEMLAFRVNVFPEREYHSNIKEGATIPIAWVMVLVTFVAPL